MARGVSLAKMSDIRRLMGKVINQLHKDQIDDSKARTMGYLCNILRDVIKDSDLESRMAEVEKILKERNQNEY